MNLGQTHIRLDGIVKSYGRQRVLKIEELSLPSRHVITLVGKNASGKSTLLRILGGICPVDGGRISRHPVLKDRRLGYMPQFGGLYGDLTLEQNFNLRRSMYGLPAVPLHNHWYIEELGLSRFMSRRTGELSGGFSRLALLATTLHCEPHWLLLDEPLSGVDTQAREVVIHHLDAVLKRMDLCVITSPTADMGLRVDMQIELENGAPV